MGDFLRVIELGSVKGAVQPRSSDPTSLGFLHFLLFPTEIPLKTACVLLLWPPLVELELLADVS